MAGWAAAITAGAALYEGHKNREATKDSSDEAFDQSREGVILGNRLDNQSYKKRDQYDWKRAQQRGLTPQEFYGSPASGGSSTSGSGATLGNQAADIEMQEASLQQQNRLATTNSIINAGVQLRGQDVDLEKAKIGAQATQDAASTSAGATVESARISSETQKAIADQNYKLAYQKFMEVELPKFKQEMKISEKEYDKLVNEIATSDPEFQKYMKKLSMGVDNMVVEYFQAIYEFDITKPDQVRALPEWKRKKFLDEVMAFQSTALKEFRGLDLGVTDALSDFGQGVTQGIEGLGNSLKDYLPDFEGLGNMLGHGKTGKGGPSHLPGSDRTY